MRSATVAERMSNLWKVIRRARCVRASPRLARAPVDRSSTTSTSYPSASSRSTRFDPTNPAPPVTRTLTAGSPSRSRRGRDAAADDGPTSTDVRAGTHDREIEDRRTGVDVRARPDDGVDRTRLRVEHRTLEEHRRLHRRALGDDTAGPEHTSLHTCASANHAPVSE